MDSVSLTLSLCSTRFFDRGCVLYDNSRQAHRSLEFITTFKVARARAIRPGGTCAYPSPSYVSSLLRPFAVASEYAVCQPTRLFSFAVRKFKQRGC